MTIDNLINEQLTIRLIINVIYRMDNRALAMELCVLTIYVAYATYFILYLKMDIAFAWTTESVYGIFILLFCYWYMKKGNWQKKQI